MRIASVATALALLLSSSRAHTLPPRATSGPFLQELGNETWVIGNEIWNMTQGRQYGVQLFYRDHNCVGDAVGHYVSYNGAQSDLNWTAASIEKEGAHNGAAYLDVKFTAREGDMHWVIFSGLAGAYQYFVNRDLPVLGEFRTLWRLDNATFTHGKTDLRDEALPPLSDYRPENKVQDETWLKPDGSGGYLTKYDLSSWIRTQSYYGVYGERFGSWYINAGKDYYNGNHLKQELMIHRESKTGDAVQLNMIHGTHFQVSAVDEFPEGKMWGPWLWYLNDGSREDAAQRAVDEFAAWPYAWLEDEAYQQRGSVRGQLQLSDGRPAAHAAVFLGDNGGNKTALDMGSDYYYTDYADAEGRFEFRDVRAATYGLQAWSNGSKIADVTTEYHHKDVVVTAGEMLNLETATWQVSDKTKIFQVGDFDRTSYGFAHGGAPYEHGLVEKCPASLNFTVGVSQTEDWCFGQSKLGSWVISFSLDKSPAPRRVDKPSKSREATLIVSLAGYSTGASSRVWANDVVIGNLTSGAAPGLLNDPSLYRSGTTAGEWRYFEFPFDAGTILKKGLNEIRFEVMSNTTWRGFMWDSIVLEW
ncbi:rhamnogalacturonase [Apiospora arundinis]